MPASPLAYTDACLRLPWITPVAAVRAVAAGATLVDLRSQREVAATGLATGALHIPMAAFEAAATPGHPGFCPALSPARTVILYCATGVRSQIAGGFLLARGHADVWNLGGLREWLDGGGTIRRQPATARSA
ncbi:MAG: rhodanese-like domain-containing protein [Gemmobacter sp.]